MKYLMLVIFLVLCLAEVHKAADEDDDESKPKETWWVGFKTRVKTVLSKWRDDMKSLWDEVLLKADDMKDWTTEVFESLKKKMKEWVESRPEVPEDEKNEIETFISKLKIPTEKPSDKPKLIEP